MRFPRSVRFFICVVVSTLPLSAQSPNANINGLVSDPSSAAVGGAEIVAVNDVTGVQYTTRTNNEGIYVLASLPPGPYRLQVSKAGFKTIIKPDIVLNVQDALSINFTLPIGATFEVLTVEGGAPLVNTESAAVSTVIDQTYMKNMPLNGRSFQDLILLTPGVVTNSPQISSANGFSGEFSVNGQRTESNNYTVDGVSGNIGAASAQLMNGGAGPSGSVPASTALGTTQALVSVDDLREFRVQSSTYSAEYGRNPGGQFAFETKSGTNQWHGTAYDYLRNGALDAPDWFNDFFGKPEPGVRQNDFGGTLGGPLEVPYRYNGKDKTFFFVSYEGLRLAAPQAATVSFVPDAALRTSAPPPLQQVLNAFPLQSPNGIDDTVNGIAQFISTSSNPASLNSTSVRFDHSTNDKLRIFFRFSDTNSRSAARGTVQQFLTPATDQLSSYIIRTYTAGASSVISSRVSNEFRFNFSSNGVRTTQNTDAIGGNAPVNLLRLAGLGLGGQVAISLILGGTETVLVQSSQSSGQKQWNLVDTVSVSLGRHEFKFGVDYRRLEPLAIPPSPAEAYDYQSKAQVQGNSLTARFAANAPAYPLYTNLSVFAQDEWKVSQRLNLSLGLRWEVNPAPSATQGLRPYTINFVSSDPNTWTLASQGSPLWQTTWFNFAPRLGAAYILKKTSGRETVLRCGAGVYFDTGQQLGSTGFQGPGFSTGSIDVSPASFPAPVVPLPITNPPMPPYFAFGFSTHLQLPYTLQWNASIEQALGRSQALTISYVGSHGSRLLQQTDFFPTNNPNAFGFELIENGLTSDYDALQAQFRRRLSRGLTALASYTWSHCMDYGSENFNFGYQRGNCNFDVRHTFSAAFSYDLPNVGHSGFVSAVLNHWGVDNRFTTRAAFPVTLTGFFLLEPNGQLYDEGLNAVPGQPIYLHGANCATVLQGLGDLQPDQTCPGGRAINPNAFVNVNSGLGDSPRNFARGFGAWQMDLAIRRDFPIHERLGLQFRAEAFNIFNHPNFGTINGQFGTTNFGQATATLASSLGVLSPLYQQGGPRSMQFALKLIF